MKYSKVVINKKNREKYRSGMLTVTLCSTIQLEWLTHRTRNTEEVGSNPTKGT